MILVELEKVLEVFGDVHPLDYNAQAYKNRIEQLKCYNLPKGKWRHSDHFMSEDWYQCSNCKNEIFLEQGTLPQNEDYNYCPKCGADMRGEE